MRGCEREKLMHSVPGCQVTLRRASKANGWEGNPPRKKGDLRMRRSQMKLGREGAV